MEGYGKCARPTLEVFSRAQEEEDCDSKEVFDSLLSGNDFLQYHILDVDYGYGEWEES